MTRQPQINRDTIGLSLPADFIVEQINQRDRSSKIKTPKMYQGSSPFFRGVGDNEFHANI